MGEEFWVAVAGGGGGGRGQFSVPPSVCLTERRSDNVTDLGTRVIMCSGLATVLFNDLEILG